MQIFHRRPLAVICVVFMAAALFGFLVQPQVKYVAASVLTVSALVAVALFAAGRLRRGTLIMTVAAVISAMLALLGSYIYFDIRYADAQKYIGASCRIEGIVTARRYTNSYSSGYAVRLDSVDGGRANYKVILDCDFVSDLQPGHRFSAVVLPERLGYGDGGADRKAAIADGFFLRCIIESDTDYSIRDGAGGFDIQVWFRDANRRIASFITRSVGGGEGELAAALALGRLDLLGSSVLRDFRRSGVTHLLALSGLHFTILMGAAELLFKRMNIPRAVRCAVLTVLTILFLALTGFAVSAIRAAIMLILVYLSFFFSREADPITSLLAAGALIIAVSPAAVADCGFWLSFCATLGIIVGMTASRGLIAAVEGFGAQRHLPAGGKVTSQKLKKPLSEAAKYIIVSTTAIFASNCAVALCIWIFFGEISLVVLLTNIVLAPLSTLVLISVFLLVCFGLAGAAPAAGLFAWLIRYGCSLMTVIAEFFSSRRGAVISLRYTFAGVIIIAMSAIYAVLCVIKIRRKWVMALPAAAAVLAFSLSLSLYGSYDSDRVKITYLQQKSSEMLLVTSGGGAVICDLSDGGRSHIYAALDVARQENVTEIDVYLLTHYHQMHVPTAESLMGREIVRRVWLPEPHDEREYGIMLSIIELARRHGVQAVIYSRGCVLTLFERAEITVDTAYIKRSTHPVITLSLAAGGERMTYAGTSLAGSGLDEITAKRIAQSRDVIFGLHGPVEKGKYSYIFDIGVLESITFGNDATLLSFAASSDTIDALGGVDMVRSPGRRVFLYSAAEVR